MKFRFTPVVLAIALAIGGCASAPGGPAGTTATSRPMSDINPVTPGDARARVHVELGMAYFEVGRYDIALDEARVALTDSPACDEVLTMCPRPRSRMSAAKAQMPL